MASARTFETIGISYQYNARNIEEANRSFNHSCHCCCHKGIRLECDRCGIAETHNLIVAYFNDMQKEG